jgi:hypothetical protein
MQLFDGINHAYLHVMLAFSREVCQRSAIAMKEAHETHFRTWNIVDVLFSAATRRKEFADVFPVYECSDR